MERCAPKPKTLGRRRQRSGRGKGRETEQNIAIRVDLLFQQQIPPVRAEDCGGQIEIAATRDAVGEKIAAAQIQLLQAGLFQRQIKQIMRVALDFQSWIAQKSEIARLLRIWQIDQDHNAFPRFWRKHGAQQAVEIKSWPLGIDSIHKVGRSAALNLTDLSEKSTRQLLFCVHL